MVAVMLGDCAGGPRSKLLCASLLGEGAASRPPPAPSHHHHHRTPTSPSSTTTSSSHLHDLAAAARTPSNSSSTASSTHQVGLSPGAALTRGAAPHHNTQHSLSSMNADTGDYQGRDSGSSLSPQGAMLPLSPSSPSNYENPTSPISPGGSRREAKQCGVCGDIAKSNHFGGRSCDSCKAFFRRSVQNNAYRAFTCPYDKKCVIGKTSRKSCQFCRFEKCLSIGMEKSWVMSEQQRREMMEQRQRRRVLEQHQGGGGGGGGAAAAASTSGGSLSGGGLGAGMPSIASTSSCFGDPSGSGLLSTVVEEPYVRLNLDEYKLPESMTEEIKLIEENYHISNNTNPYEACVTPSSTGAAGASAAATGGGAGGVFNTWMHFCKKIGHFFSLFPDFSSLSDNDQRILLTPAMTSAGIIMGSVTIDSWMGKKKASGSMASFIPKLSFENIERLVPEDLLYRIKTFFAKFRMICPDEAMAKILILVSLYSPELPGLRDDARIQELQDHYINMLECYIKYKYRSCAGHKFAKAIVSLADVRELAERSMELKLKRSVPTDLATASSDPSSGGNNSEFQGSGGGSFGGPSSSSGGGGGGGGFSDAAAGGGLGDLRGRGHSSEGGNSSSSGGCSDSFNMIRSGLNSSFNLADFKNSNISQSGLLDLAKSMGFSRNSSMETDDQAFTRLRGQVKSMTGFPSTELTPQNHAKLNQRQLSDLRIQELIKNIPPPAIMKIIHLMADDLDIEAKKTDNGIKFLRKHGTSYGAEKNVKNAGARRKSNGSQSGTSDAFDPSSKPFPARSFMDVDIKEEQMDFDGSDENELNTIKMIGNAFDNATGGVPVSTFSSNNSRSHSLNQQQQNPNTMVIDGLVMTENSPLDQDTLSSNPFQFQQDHSNRGDIFSSNRRNRLTRSTTSNDSYQNGNQSSENNHHHHHHHQLHNRVSLSPSRLGPINGIGRNATTSPTNDSSLAAVPSSSCNPRQQQHRGNGSLSVQLPVSFSFSVTSPSSLLMPTDVPSHILPDVPNRTLDPSCSSSSVTSSNTSSSQIHTSSFANGTGPLSGDVLSTAFQSPSTDRYGNGFSVSSSLSQPLNSPPDSHSVGGECSYRAQTSPSPPSSYPSSGGGGHIQTASHACVQKQIMALSIQSPGSPPNENSNGSYPVSSTEQTFGSHPREYSSHFSIQPQQPARQSCQQQQQAYQSLFHGQQQQPSHVHVAPQPSTLGGMVGRRCDPNFLVNYHQQNKDIFLATKDSSFTDTIMHGTALHNFSISQSPSPHSTSSNSSPEDSADSFDRSLFHSPINLSALSDVESAVLQIFFEHINTHVTEPMLEGKHWNTETEVLLPKTFLANLQAKLKTEQE